jgi:hypothetical protein
MLEHKKKYISSEKEPKIRIRFAGLPQNPKKYYRNTK